MTERDESRVLVVRTQKERVFEYLSKHPTISNPGLYYEFPNINKSSIRDYKSQWKKLGNVKEVVGALKLVLDIFKFKVKLIHKLNKEEKEALFTLEDFLKNV